MSLTQVTATRRKKLRHEIERERDTNNDLLDKDKALASLDFSTLSSRDGSERLIRD